MNFDTLKVAKICYYSFNDSKVVALLLLIDPLHLEQYVFICGVRL